MNGTSIDYDIWKRRNLKIFEQKEETNESLLIRARAILNNMDRENIMIKGTCMNAVCIQSQNEVWKNPPQGYLKLNVDGAFSLKFGGGYGGILRDENDCNMPTDVG